MFLFDFLGLIFVIPGFCVVYLAGVLLEKSRTARILTGYTGKLPKKRLFGSGWEQEEAGDRLNEEEKALYEAALLKIKIAGLLLALPGIILIIILNA